MVCQLWRAARWTANNIYLQKKKAVKDQLHPLFLKMKSVLCLSLSPLLALLIALREWDVFFLGTASTIAGNSRCRAERKGNIVAAAARVSREVTESVRVVVEGSKRAMNDLVTVKFAFDVT
jgi:hypothetical protein